MVKAFRALRLGKLKVLILALAAGSACLAAPGGVMAAPLSSVRTLSQSGWTLADFDGDSQPDVAVTKMETRDGGYVYWLEVDLSTKTKKVICARAMMVRLPPVFPFLGSI